jgi:two-component sensor histidine kinase
MKAEAKIPARASFPAALSKTEPHLSDLQRAMLNATPDCIKLVSVDGRLLAMNRAGCIALNVPEDSEFGMPWIPLLPEDVHQLGEEALHEAANGGNARFPGKSMSPDGIRYWDNLLTPLIDASGHVLSILCVSRDVTAQTKLEKDLEDGIGRERLLAREMQHRIKNLFSVVLGLIFIAEKEAKRHDKPETATKILREKLGALSRASDAAFATPDIEETIANDVELEPLVRSVLQPYGDRCLVIGSRASISRSITTTLALFLHELATNAVKYGALSTDDGNITTRWATGDGMLKLTWIETGGPQIMASPDRQGFGSEMIDRIVRSSGGRIIKSWRVKGLTAEIYLPNSASD